MATQKSKKPTPFQQVMLEAAKTVKEYKLSCEANIVSIFYCKPDLMYDYQLKLEDLTENTWRVFWQIAYDIVIVEKKAVLDQITIGLYLEKHKKLQAKYDEYGGYDTIEKAKQYVEIENISGYVNELYKWNTVMHMIKNGFPVYDRIKDFTDMKLDEIYEEYEAMLNHIFVNASNEVKTYNACDGINDYIDKLNEGVNVGLPLHNADILNKEIGGFNCNGNIYGLGASSGCVDCDTEYFNGLEWKKISEYQIGDKVLQYNKDGSAELVNPIKYIKQKREYLWEIKSKYGVSMCLSDEHNVIYQSCQTGCGNVGGMNEIKFKDLKNRHENNKNGFAGRFYTTFDYAGQGINLSDNEIRLMVAVFADGSFYYHRDNLNYDSYYQVRFHIKKDRKKIRLEKLLLELNIEYKKVSSKTVGYDDYYFNVPLRQKHYPKEWYNCSKHQFEIIADEVMNWDGWAEKNNCYSTTNKSDADFIQFVYSSLGYRTTINTHNRAGRKRIVNNKEYTTKSIDYIVRYTKRNMVSIMNATKKIPINEYKTKDGYEYCFTVPSHMLVLRREDKIFITGNCGKSTSVMDYIIPSILKYDEKVVFFINEEDQTKVQRELIVWVANNVLKLDLPKYKLRDGNFDEETLDILRKTAAWIEEKKENRNITIIPLERYSVNIVIKLIKKYSALGVRYFVLDTLKESCDAKTDEIYKSMTRDMVKLYDVVKPTAKDVGLFVTYQLGKSSIKMRYLTNNEIGMGKSIVDVMSVNLMIRRPFEDEYEGGKREITGYRFEGKNGKSKVPFKLKRDKHYMITFIPKNRFGQTDAFQIISEFDFSTNTNKDIGICNITQDW